VPRRLYRAARARLRLGPTRGELREQLAAAHASRHAAIAERDYYRRGLDDALAGKREQRVQIRALRRQLADLPALLVEPGPADGCTKTRLHTRDEAEAFRLRLAERTGGDPGRLNSYPCRICPRHPATGDRFWHVGHHSGARTTGDQAASRSRARRAANEAARNGTRIGDRVDLAAVVARLDADDEARRR
jgi:hypothetical protein